MTIKDESRFAAASQNLSVKNRQLFVSPEPAGRKITAGFSFLQRMGKQATTDIWFPEQLQDDLNEKLARGITLGPDNFPAEWAAVRQFELLQDAGNYKIYDMEVGHLRRTLYDCARNMKGGGYRVTVATIGSYVSETEKDDLEILDKRLQKRIAQMINMLYLEEQSASIDQANDALLAADNWDFQNALPHISVTLGSRDLFRPIKAGARLNAADRNHKLSQQFFEILKLLPQKHILHDTAVGLQLPEMINEQEWIYVTQAEHSMRSFNTLLTDLFSPFDGISMSALDGREDAKPEIKRTTQHMRSYGDRLTPESDQFYRDLAALTLH
ncbi:MAG: hypothetical protein WAO98_09145 [Alphaproteobacteria bacterium]